jgi:Na+/H+-dicarboxylate symporter
MSATATTMAGGPAAPKKSGRFYKSLFFQVLVALILGIALGAFEPAFAIQL